MGLVISFYRSGTHFLMKTIFHSFDTPFSSYEKLHHSHAALTIPGNYIQIVRHPQPVMVSMFKLRDRFGIGEDISFKDFLRTPFAEMPTTEACEVVHNGRLETQTARRLLKSRESPLDFMERILKNHIEHSNLCISYEELLNDSTKIMESLKYYLNWKCINPSFRCNDRVGYWPYKSSEEVFLDEDDKALLLESAQNILKLAPNSIRTEWEKY